MYERLTASRAHREGGLLVLPLHSSVSPQEQRRVFERPPHRARKIVLATNIAETSLTIEDVVYVVDSGKLKVPSLLCKFLLYIYQTIEPQSIESEHMNMTTHQDH